MQIQYIVRQAEPSDLHKIMFLYKTVASRSSGIARQADEITESYVQNFIERSLEKGIILVIEDLSNPDTLVAEVHTCSPGIRVFSHIFNDLTISVHPYYQGKGVGTLIFKTFLQVLPC